MFTDLNMSGAFKCLHVETVCPISTWLMYTTKYKYLLITTHILNCYNILQPFGHFPGPPRKHSVYGTQRCTSFILLIIPVLVSVEVQAIYEYKP
jgi:hypothetical protein